MIFANPYGGIGNQLFCYAFIRAIQEEANEKYVFFSRKRFEWAYIRKRRAVPEYIFDYYTLLPEKMIVLNGNISKILSLAYCVCSRFLFSKKKSGLTKNEFIKRVKMGYICSQDEKSLCDNISELPLYARLKYIEGYFQWPNIFLNFRQELKKEITLKTSLEERDIEILEKIQSSEAVCLHIRRGDYLSVSWANVCNYQYYKTAMDYIAGKVDNPIFFVFSDDISWVEENYIIPYDHVFVKEHHAAPFELELMRNCKHFIMSNSTFSWWAQFLTENEAAIVVAPKPWYADGRECSLYLSHWHTIDCYGGMDK